MRGSIDEGREHRSSSGVTVNLGSLAVSFEPASIVSEFSSECSAVSSSPRVLGEADLGPSYRPAVQSPRFSRA
jgi:hypothetical protein